MRKTIAIILIVFLIVGSFSAIATNYDDKEGIKLQKNKITLSFPKLSIEKTGTEYLELEMDDISTYLMQPGKPILPKIVKTIELPFGIKNVKVEVDMGKPLKQEIKEEIKPSPQMLPKVALTKKVTKEEIELKDLATYESNDPYPSSQYDYVVRSGLNKENKRVTHLIINIYPVIYTPKKGIIDVFQNSDIKITYEEKDLSLTESEGKDLVIITPNKFKKYLEELEKHKNDIGVKTFIKTTEEIYDEYDKRDKPEEIKYFIKDAIEEYDIKYVLLVGGLKSQIHATPRDTPNYGAKGWYLPVRYTNLYDKPKFPLNSEEEIFDPGVISDLYYADIYGEGGSFSSWDTNNDDIFAAWAHPNPKIKDDTDIDMEPDVCVGRLACRSVKEVKTVVDKIINYETKDKSDWFNKMTVISGDGFLDQEDWNIQWDTTGKEGNYIIYAQSLNDEGEEGPVDTIPIKIDRNQATNINFNHDDHLNPAIEGFNYPAPPIAEIVSISPGDILGYNEYTYTPGENEAYCNNFNPWANISFENNILTIRGKSYDPKPYGNITHVRVWVTDTKGEIVFEEWVNNMEMYYEGEWTTGEKVLKGRGGALYYMDGFEKEILWTSNGKFTGPDDVINELNKGSGFVFMSGHGSPNSWGDHYPGAPGNRQYGSVTGLTVTSLNPWRLKISLPLYPMDQLSNKEKLPVAVIGGCHNSQFNVSMILGVLDLLPYISKIFPEKYMWCHGTAVPECFSWRLVRNPNGGAIASIGNTGLGYGMPGKDLTTGGGDGWITIDFFYQYGHEGQTILGAAHSQAITHYIQTFDMTDLESGHPKSVQQWVLLGDPSLEITE